MSSENWYLRHFDKVEHGPYPLDVLVKAARAGNIAPDTDVRHETHTRGQWMRALRVRPIAEAMPAADSTTAPPVMQGPERNQPPVDRQPGEPTGPPTITPVAERSPKRRKQSGLIVPTTALNAFFALFDFRFRYFVTPWIIKIYWVMAVLAMLVYLVSHGSEIAIGYSASDQDSSYSSGSNSGYEGYFGLPENTFGESEEQPLHPAISKPIVATYRLLKLVFAAVTVLLSVRVMLELAIVAFRIAEDLADVRTMANNALRQ